MYPDIRQELLNTKLNVLCIFLETEGWEGGLYIGVNTIFNFYTIDIIILATDSTIE
jgi:hypothetical protein